MAEFDFVDDETPDTPEQPNPEDSKPFQDLRKHTRGLEKEVKELRAFKEAVEAEKRQAASAEVFTGLGIDPARASWFKADNPEADPTRDAVASWAAAAGLIEAAGEPASEGYAPTVVTDSSAVGMAVITDPDEATKLFNEDPIRYMQLREKGRIKLERMPGNLQLT